MVKVYIPKTTGASNALDKVVVPLGEDEWHGFGEEAVWARRLGDGLYEVQNSPFFAKGLAYLDVVRATRRDDRLLVVEVVTPSRHSTYRLLVKSEAPQSQVRDSLNELVASGCTFESYVESGWTLYSFDVPPAAIDAAYRVISAAERNDLWDFEEGHFGGREH